MDIGDNDAPVTHADWCADRDHRAEDPCESAPRVRHGVTVRILSGLPTTQGVLDEQCIWLSAPGGFVSRRQLDDLLAAGRLIHEEITQPIPPQTRRPA